MGSSDNGSENDIVTVTQNLRNTSKGFPSSTLAFAKLNDSEYLIMDQHGIATWSTSSNEKRKVALKDVYLNGKLVTRYEYDIRYLFKPYVQKLEAKENKNPPTDEQIKLVENTLNMRFRPELKTYLKRYGQVGYNYVVFTGVSSKENVPSSIIDGLDEVTENFESSVRSGQASGTYPKYMIPLIELGDGVWLMYNNNTGEGSYWSYGDSFDKPSTQKNIDEILFAGLYAEYTLNNL